jgi:hypothetical protein
MIDPNLLIDRTPAAVPAPWWFVQFFKALGFTLHAVPMNLWYAGLLIALLLHLRGSEQGRHFGRRLLQQMPILVALGVNFGIVPLLFIQVAYYKVFYPATILMAWFWLAIILLLIPAYYGVYAYALGLRSGGSSETTGSGQLSCDGDSLALWRKAAGWLAAVLFLCIGFLFANGLSLMDHVGRWPELFAAHNVAGAATGTALNVGDPTLWPRWLLMFGLALQTTAVWVLVDAVFLTRGTTDERYQQWAWGFARKLYTLGMIWAAAAGSWYVFGAWTPELRATMFRWPLVLLTVATAVAAGLPWLLMMTAGLCSAKRATVAAVALCQFGVLGVNAVSRQIVQNVNIDEFLSVSTQRTDVQWSPLAMFLIVFVIGLGVVGWMIAQVLRCEPKKG